MTSYRLYAQGQLIIDLQEGRDRTLILVSGLARVYRISTQGKELTLAKFVTGDILGLAPNDPILQPSNLLEAIADGTGICRVPREHFQQIIISDPEIASYCFCQLSERLGKAYDLIEEVVFMDVCTRLARTLSRLAKANEQRLVTATHQELAGMIGTSQEEVTRKLRHLRELGLINYQPHHRGIVVPNPDRLLSELNDLT
ncbi:Crp/Fnr family transcriptional regulator [Thermobaculum terrenum]|nr:Crp/Fnr family transcriptional regulator [Thermobaculum terrenum]